MSQTTTAATGALHGKPKFDWMLACIPQEQEQQQRSEAEDEQHTVTTRPTLMIKGIDRDRRLPSSLLSSDAQLSRVEEKDGGDEGEGDRDNNTNNRLSLGGGMIAGSRGIFNNVLSLALMEDDAMLSQQQQHGGE